MSLVVTDVSYTYPGTSTPVLSHCSIDVKRGESVAVTGPSGAGKSTLLGVAGLLLRPQSGTVEIDGQTRDTSEQRKLARGTITWILQTVNLLPRRTVLDNIVLPALLTGERRDTAEGRALELLDRVGLGGFEAREARNLSGGQAQRVGIARALISRPSVLLADEPTANLDPHTAAQIGDILVAASEDVVLLLTTHDGALAACCDRIVSWEDLVRDDHAVA